MRVAITCFLLLLSTVAIPIPVHARCGDDLIPGPSGGNFCVREDPVDSYRLIGRTTNLSAEWKDSIVGIWNSLTYTGNMILIDSSNKNTITFDGTRKIYH